MKSNFFDRKPYLDILEKRIRDLKNGYRQNIAIIGDELIGKTSIIFKFLDRFCDNRIIFLYLEIRPESLNSFARRFSSVLLYNFLSNSGIPLKEDLSFLIEKASRYIPKTAERIKFILNALSKRKKNNIFTELLSLCDLINQETGKSCVVILDEFHNLENIDIKNIYAEWSKLLVLQKNTMYIIISSNKFKAKAILSKNLSLLFGNFETISVEPFDTGVSEEYLEHRLGKTDIGPGLKNFIIHFTGGCPFYLELITESLLGSNHANLTDILEDLMFTPSGLLNQKFSNYLKRFLDLKHSQDYISILHLVSQGHNKLKDIAHILHKTKDKLMLRLSQLLEFDTLSRSGDFLKINDRVFGFWLRFVHQEKLRSLTFDAKSQKAAFRENIERLIQEFISCCGKPIAERITELMPLFEDETMQLESKKFKLSRFREIKPLVFNNRGLKEGLLGRSNDSLWIMALNYDFLTEEDITEFTRECKKYQHKLQRKIIVILQDMDTNARLRALEEKIWMWDLNSLNQILDIFSKPRIIT